MGHSASAGSRAFSHRIGEVAHDKDGPGLGKYTILSPARCQRNDLRSSGREKKETNFQTCLFSNKKQFYKPTILSRFTYNISSEGDLWEADSTDAPLIWRLWHVKMPSLLPFLCFPCSVWMLGKVVPSPM